MARSRSDNRARGDAKRTQIIEAAMAALVDLGFSRASTRAIAERGGFNQALIHYYFGSLNALWLAVIDHTSAIRMERYRAAVAEAGDLEQIVDVAVTIYREDLESGQMTIISELVAGSLSEPDLGKGIVDRMEPWVDFVGDVLSKLLDGSPLAQLIPKRESAIALVSLYLGVNLLTRLEPDRVKTDALFETARGFAPLLSPLLGVSAGGAAQ